MHNNQCVISTHQFTSVWSLWDALVGSNICHILGIFFPWNEHNLLKQNIPYSIMGQESTLSRDLQQTDKRWWEPLILHSSVHAVTRLWPQKKGKWNLGVHNSNNQKLPKDLSNDQKWIWWLCYYLKGVFVAGLWILMHDFPKPPRVLKDFTCLTFWFFTSFIMEMQWR